MEIRYFYPYWGSEDIPVKSFLSTVCDNGFHGIEINFPKAIETAKELSKAREKGLTVIGQQVLGNQNESPQEYIRRAIERLESIKNFQPEYINSHTGKDYFDFEDNCMIINELEEWSLQNNIPLMHEIHRGRFTFHPKLIQPYLEKFPSISLVGDFSHWCTVSESLLEDQEECIEKTIPFIKHIHARVGWSQSAQVNDPFAPEWSDTLKTFTSWWQKSIDYNREKDGKMNITPEFGPFPYLPETPYERKPLADQKKINLKMKSYLQETLDI